MKETKMKDDFSPSFHIFIIWENSRPKLDMLLNDIKTKFSIREIYEITWDDDFFVDNLRRFYGATLPDPHAKAKECGFGPFLVVFLEDNCPTMSERGYRHRRQIVNTNVFDAKMKYRKWLGGDFRIHGSNNEKETNHDLVLLLGKNIHDLLQTITSTWDGSYKKIKRNLSGSVKWKNLDELFYTLNNSTNYLVLRNFEELSDNFFTSEHKDIDVLTDDLWQISYVVNKKIRSQNETGPSSYVKIDSHKVKIDFKVPGDNYYDKNWEETMLERKILSDNSIFIPDVENYFYSLLYHIIVHKKKLSPDYIEKLKLLSKNLSEPIPQEFDDFAYLKKFLDNFLQKNGYKNTDSSQYRIFHNHYFTLLHSAYYIAKKQGLRRLLKSIKGRSYRKNLLKSGRI